MKSGSLAAFMAAAELPDHEDDVPPPRKRIGATTDSIALIASRNGHGVILAHDGDGIEADIEAVGLGGLDDHGLDDAPDGLSIWEGHMSGWGPDHNGEYDCELRGKFRHLTEAEWSLYRSTGTPWEFEPTELPGDTKDGGNG